MNNTKEVSLKNKEFYKISIILLKVLPMVMVASYFVMLLFFYFNSNLVIVPHLLGTVGVPLAFIYITSYVFRFCAFHRLFIHYYAFIDVLNVSDHYLHPYFNEKIVTCLHDGGTLIFIITAVIMYMYKYKRDLCMKILSSCGSTKVIE